MKVLCLLVTLTLFAATSAGLTNGRLSSFRYTVDGGYDNNEPEAIVILASEELYIPCRLRNCNGAVCEGICRALGFKYGECVDPNTCRCHN